MIAKLVEWRLHKKSLDTIEENQHLQVGTLIACGLVAGSALIDIVLAIPFSILHSPDALQLTGPGWNTYGVVLALVSTLLLAGWIERRVTKGR